MYVDANTLYRKNDSSFSHRPTKQLFCHNHSTYNKNIQQRKIYDESPKEFRSFHHNYILYQLLNLLTVVFGAESGYLSTLNHGRCHRSSVSQQQSCSFAQIAATSTSLLPVVKLFQPEKVEVGKDS